MNEFELEEQAQRAVAEEICSYTVVIDVSFAKQEVSWGTGALLRFNDRYFIVTCKHVVKPEFNDADLRCLYRADRPLVDADKDKIKFTPIITLAPTIAKSYPDTLQIKKRFYSADLIDDLAVIELEPSSDAVKNYTFFDLSRNRIQKPTEGMTAYLMGFSRELARQVDAIGNAGVFPYSLSAEIVNKNIDHPDFDPQRHFLIDHQDSDHSVDPRGLSGCGVWTRKPSGKDNLWTTNLYFSGIETSCYTDSKVLQATSAERVLKLLDNN